MNYKMSDPSEANMLYFIDQYIDNRFMSRSEPFYDKDTAIEMFDRLQSTASSDVYYRVSVSLPLEDYESLVLSTHRIKIKFLERDSREASTVTSSTNLEEEVQKTPSQNIKAYRYNNGYVLLNNKKSRNFLDEHNLHQYFHTIGKKDLFYVSKYTISTLHLSFLDLLKVKNMNDKVLNLIN